MSSSIAVETTIKHLTQVLRAEESIYRSFYRKVSENYKAPLVKTEYFVVRLLKTNTELIQRLLSPEVRTIYLAIESEKYAVSNPKVVLQKSPENILEFIIEAKY
jgi:hypothetical protein